MVHDQGVGTNTRSSDLTTQGFSFALAPTQEQERFLACCAGASRFWFNQALALVKERLDRRERGEQVSVPWGYHALCSEFSAAQRNALASWQPEVVCGSYMAGFEMLGRGLENFSEGRKAGRRVGFPRFKAKGRCREAVIWQRPRLVDHRRVELDRRIAPVRTKEPLKKLIRLLERDPEARILRATVARSSERRGWTISFTVARSRRLKLNSRARRSPRLANAAAAVDVGIAARATLSTGDVLANLHLLREAQKKLRRFQRRADRQRRANNPGNYDADGTCKPFAERAEWVASKRQRETEAKISRVHERVANIRRDQAHKLTSFLVSEFGAIGVESLNVAGMLRNRRLARAIADVGWGEILRQLRYKTAWSDGCLLVAADRYYPSSKTCSGCGMVKAKLSLSARVFACDDCGVRIDRDLNAALNLALMALRFAQGEGRVDAYVARRGRETLNARGGLVRPAAPADPRQGPVKREGQQVLVARSQAGHFSGASR